MEQTSPTTSEKETLEKVKAFKSRAISLLQQKQEVSKLSSRLQSLVSEFTNLGSAGMMAETHRVDDASKQFESAREALSKEESFFSAIRQFREDIKIGLGNLGVEILDSTKRGAVASFIFGETKLVLANINVPANSELVTEIENLRTLIKQL